MEDNIDTILFNKSTKFAFSDHYNSKLPWLAAGMTAGVYTVWAMFVLPGFRKVPWKLKVPYLPSGKAQTANVLKLLQGRKGRLVDLGSGDGRLADLSKYNNVTVFLAPNVVQELEKKLSAELPEDARVIVCRFPFSEWQSTCSEGAGLDQVWAYDLVTVRKQPDHNRSQQLP